MRIAIPPCLLIAALQQPGAFSPPSQLKHSSEGVIWMCRAFFTSSYCLCHGPALWSPPSGPGGGSPMHAPLQLTSPSPPSQRHPSVTSVSSPVSVWSPRCRPKPQLQGIQYTTLDCLRRSSVSLTLVNIEQESAWT